VRAAIDGVTEGVKTGFLRRPDDWTQIAAGDRVGPVPVKVPALKRNDVVAIEGDEVRFRQRQRRAQFHRAKRSRRPAKPRKMSLNQTFAFRPGRGRCEARPFDFKAGLNNNSG
jgi:hypothetical protein